MAAKKKTKKKHTKLKKTAAKKGRPIRKKAPKKSLKRKRALKKTAVKTKAPVRKGAGAKRTRKVDTKSFAPQGRRPRPVPQSGDLQGISNVEAADSESVGELIEEGNAFEADVVMGVEEAGERSNREVHTREVPEDDVPGEYLDKE